MSVNPLKLKFGTALFCFRDVKQMTAFLGTHCIRDRKGKVWLHHGFGFHEFTELAAEYYRNIPKKVEWYKKKRTEFMLGKVSYLSSLENEI